MQHLQLWHGNWRVRKPVPKHLQAIVGRGAYLTRTLGTPDYKEAEKRAHGVLAEFQDTLDRAERVARGEVRICQMMGCMPRDRLLALTAPRPEDELLSFAGHAPPAPATEATPKIVPFEDLLASWGLTVRNPQTRDKYAAKVAKLTRFLGHDDAARVTPEDIVAFKKNLLENPKLAARTALDTLTCIRTILRQGVADRVLTADPSAGITIKVKQDRKTKRLGYSAGEAARILKAAIDQPPHIKFPCLIAAWSGSRLSEIVESHSSDLQKRKGRWVLVLSEENRGENCQLKNDGSERVLPLHQEIVDAGIVKYRNSVPVGPLFPQYRPNKYGRRGPDASKKIGKFVRRLGMTNRRLAPNHSWRHYMKTVSRSCGISEEVHDALTGHAAPSEGRKYGDVEIQVLADAVAKLPNPLRDPPPEDEDEPLAA